MDQLVAAVALSAADTQRRLRALQLPTFVRQAIGPLPRPLAGTMTAFGYERTDTRSQFKIAAVEKLEPASGR